MAISIDIKNFPPILRRAFMFMEEADWENADRYLDLYLEQNPNDAYAFLGKAMVSGSVKSPQLLPASVGKILDSPYLSMAIRCADPELKAQLDSLIGRKNEAASPSPEPVDEDAIPQGAVPVFSAPRSEPEENFSAFEFSPPEIIPEPLQPKAVPVTGFRFGETRITAADLLPSGEERKKKKKGWIVLLILLLLAAVAAAAWFWVLPHTQYNKALGMLRDGSYEEGLQILTELNDFSDAPEQYQKGSYEYAISLIESGHFDKGITMLTELGDYSDSASQITLAKRKRASAEVRTILEADVGTFVTFGRYDTDSDKTNGPEELLWRVLSSQNNTVTLITEKCVAGMPYNNVSADTDWASCSLRAWLNADFYQAAFDAEEAEFIRLSEVPNPNNIEFGTAGGAATRDKVYLLSISEAEQLFPTFTQRKAQGTHSAYLDLYTDENDYCCWWLRTPGAHLTSAAGVGTDGMIVSNGYNAYLNDQLGVRPVIVIAAAP